MSLELAMYNAQLLIFHGEILAIITAGVYRWQRTGIKDGALSSVLVLLSFLLLWSLTSFVSAIFVSENAPVVRDTVSLMLLLPIQYLFLKLLFPRSSKVPSHG